MIKHTWIENYKDEKIYPYTHSDAVFVDAKTDKNLTEELEDINNRIGQIPDGYVSKINFEQHLDSNAAHRELFDKKLNAEAANTLIKDMKYDNASGTITVKRLNDTVFTINIPKSLIFQSAIFDENANEIVITWSDDSQSKLPVGALIDIYTGSEGEAIQIVVNDNNVISAIVKEGSIGKPLLSQDVKSDLENLVNHTLDIQKHIPNGGNVGQVIGKTDAGVEWVDQNENENLSVALEQKVDKVTGMGLSSNDYSSAEKEKLNNIENMANRYVHPETHPATMITIDDQHQFVTAAEKALIGSGSSISNISFDKETAILTIGNKEIDLSSLKGDSIIGNGELTPGFNNKMLWQTFNTEGVNINRIDYLNGYFVAIGGTYLFYGTEFPHLQKINLSDYANNSQFALINIHYYYGKYYLIGLDDTNRNSFISYIFVTENFKNFEVKIIEHVYAICGLFYNGNNYVVLREKGTYTYVTNMGKWSNDFLTGTELASIASVYNKRNWIMTSSCMSYNGNSSNYFYSGNMWETANYTYSNNTKQFFINKTLYQWYYYNSHHRLDDPNGVIWDNSNFTSKYNSYLLFKAGIECNGKYLLVCGGYGVIINNFQELDNILANDCKDVFTITSSNIIFITHNYEYVAASTDTGELIYAKIS